MRVIAGVAKGRRLAAPAGIITRPMTDRAREGLFSSIAVHLPGARVIDLYAGTGSLGLEALSRGAQSVIFVERDRAALKALRVNVAAVGLGGEVLGAETEHALTSTLAAKVVGPFDLAFVDPPYADSLASVEAILSALMPFLDDGAMAVVHRLQGERRPTADGLGAAGERSYGTATLWRYLKEPM